MTSKSGTAEKGGGGGAGGAIAPPHFFVNHIRFSNLTILNAHKERTDRLCLLDVANDVCDRNENRKRNFGRFNESDCHQQPSYICAVCKKDC